MWSDTCTAFFVCFDGNRPKISLFFLLFALPRMESGWVLSVHVRKRNVLASANVFCFRSLCAPHCTAPHGRAGRVGQNFVRSPLRQRRSKRQISVQRVCMIPLFHSLSLSLSLSVSSLMDLRPFRAYRKYSKLRFIFWALAGHRSAQQQYPSLELIFAHVSSKASDHLSSVLFLPSRVREPLPFSMCLGRVPIHDPRWRRR